MCATPGIRMLITLDRLAGVATPLRSVTNLESIVITSLSEYSPEATPPAATPGVHRLADLLAEGAVVDLPRVDHRSGR